MHTVIKVYSKLLFILSSFIKVFRTFNKHLTVPVNIAIKQTALNINKCQKKSYDCFYLIRKFSF